MRFKYSFWESKIPRWTGLSSECLSHVSRNHRGPEECTRGGFKANKVIMLTGCLFRNTTSNIFWQKNDLKKRKKNQSKAPCPTILEMSVIEMKHQLRFVSFSPNSEREGRLGRFPAADVMCIYQPKIKKYKKKVAVLSWCDWCLAQFPFSSPDQTNRRTPGVSIATWDEVEKTFVFLDVDVD